MKRRNNKRILKVALRMASPILRLDKYSTANRPSLHLRKLLICQCLSKLRVEENRAAAAKKELVHS
jgi:hypothetical protein